MAINFPSNPNTNDTHTVNGRTWVWDGAAWKLSGTINNGISLEVSDTAPATPIEGDMWYDSSTGSTFTYYDSVWVELGNTASVVSFIADSDGDTRVHVEESADEDTIRFDTAGTERLTITSAGHVLPSADVTYDLGSSSYRFRDLYLSGSSIDLGGVTISSDGTSLSMPPIASVSGDFTVDTSTLHVDSANNRVGIGTTSPRTLLEVQGSSSGTVDELLLLAANGNQVSGSGSRLHLSGGNATTRSVYIEGVNTGGSTNAHAMIFGTSTDSSNPVERMRINSSGNVGIGTTSPQTPLAVNGDIDMVGTGRSIVFGRQSEGGPFGLEVWNGGALESSIVYRTSPDAWSFENSSGTDILTVDIPNQRVGIGTDSPAANLQVVSQNRAFSVLDTGVNNNAEAGFTSLGSDSPAFGAISGYDVDIKTGTTRAGLASRLHVHRDGNVGIGDTTPSYKLDVAGTFRATGVSYFENTLICDSNNNTTPFYVGRYTSTNEAIAIAVADRDGYIYMNQDETSGASYLHLSVNGQSGSTQRIYMDDNLYCGFVSKSSGSFTIDHPIPEMSDTHYLRHSFVEGPQADNLYRGRATLVDGTVSVNIDEAAGMTEGTFALLNRDIQCWVTNDSGWTAVRGSVSGNILTIEAQDLTCADSVSWLVMGERQDQHMYDTDWTDEEGHIIVEPEKDDPSIAPRTWLQHQEELASQEAN